MNAPNNTIPKLPTASIPIMGLDAPLRTSTTANDPYILRRPDTSYGAFTQRVWWAGQFVQMFSVMLAGIAVVLIAMTYIVASTGVVPGFGDTGLMLLPWTVGGIFGGFVLRRWATRVHRQSNRPMQAAEACFGALGAFGAAVISGYLAHFTIMIVALLTGV